MLRLRPAASGNLLAEHLDDLVATEASEVVRLLPGFDQYVLGPGTGAMEVIPRQWRALVSRQAGWISPVVVHGGRVVGVWEPRAPQTDIPAVVRRSGGKPHRRGGPLSRYFGRDLNVQVRRA